MFVAMGLVASCAASATGPPAWAHLFGATVGVDRPGAVVRAIGPPAATELRPSMPFGDGWYWWGCSKRDLAVQAYFEPADPAKAHIAAFTLCRLSDFKPKYPSKRPKRNTNITDSQLGVWSGARFGMSAKECLKALAPALGPTELDPPSNGYQNLAWETRFEYHAKWWKAEASLDFREEGLYNIVVEARELKDEERTPPDLDSLLLLPRGAEPIRTFHVDLKGDGVQETVVVSRVVHCPIGLDERHVVVTVLKPSRVGLKVVCNKEVGMPHYLGCFIGDVDRDGKPEIAVETLYEGGDFGNVGWDFLRWELGTVRWVGEAGGSNGGVELLDVDHDGRLGTKEWSEWWHGHEAHSDVHEHITTLKHWRKGTLVPFKSYLYDDKTGRVGKPPKEPRETAEREEPAPPPLPSTPRRLAQGWVNCCEPVWSPDGKRVAFVHGLRFDFVGFDEETPSQLCVVIADGTGARQLTHFDNCTVFWPRWSPDGRYLLAWTETARKMGKDPTMWIVPVDGGEPRRLAGMRDSFTSWLADSSGVCFENTVFPVDGGPSRPKKKGEHEADGWKNDAGGTKAGRDDPLLVIERGKRKWVLAMKPGSFAEPAVSPDGRHVTFQHWEDGVWNAYVVDVPK